MRNRSSDARSGGSTEENFGERMKAEETGRESEKHNTRRKVL